MSVTKSITNYFDKLVDAYFKRGEHGQLSFHPMGIGAGRLVPDEATEAYLRKISRHTLIWQFVGLVPAVVIAELVGNPKGIQFVPFLVASMVLGVICSLYPVFASRRLAHSGGRLGVTDGMMHRLDLFSMKFLVFGLSITSMGAIGGLLLLVFKPSGAKIDPMTMLTCVAVFSAFAAVYLIVIIRRCSRPTADI